MKYECNSCGDPCRLEVVGGGGWAAQMNSLCKDANWRKVEPAVEPPPYPEVAEVHLPNGYTVTVTHDETPEKIEFVPADEECPGCKEKGERIKELVSMDNAKFARIQTLEVEIARLNNNLACKNKEITALTRELVAHIGDVGQVQSEADQLASIRDHCASAREAEIKRLNELLNAKILDASDEFLKTRASMTNEIERLKETNLELHNSIYDALSGKLSGEGITFDGWPLSYWREMKEQNERLETAMTNLESQQEADTETAGILADVVDILFEEGDRCERFGYTNVKARAVAVIKRNYDLRKGFEDLDRENGVLRAERDALNDAIKTEVEFHREVVVIKDETIKSECTKNAGMVDNIAAIKKTLDKLAKKKK